MNNEFVALRYKRNEWGLYGKTCKCFIVFGTKKEIQERAKKLNEGVEQNGKIKI